MGGELLNRYNGFGLVFDPSSCGGPWYTVYACDGRVSRGMNQIPKSVVIAIENTRGGEHGHGGSCCVRKNIFGHG